MGDGEERPQFTISGVPYGSRTSLARHTGGLDPSDHAVVDVRRHFGPSSVEYVVEATLEPEDPEDFVDGEFVDVFVMGRFQDGMWRATKMALEDLCAIGGRALWRKLK